MLPHFVDPRPPVHRRGGGLSAGVENVILIQGRYKAAIEDHFDIS
jgi:UTP-glucose-1-phosphate uridylyltransferase